MKTIQALALLGAALIAACSERQTATAPSADASAPAPALTGDRPYTWSLTCQSSAKSAAVYPIFATWSWTENRVTIPGTDQSAYCYPNGTPNNTVSGSGTRPGNANGFSACVGNYPTNCQSWTFDPSSSFRAQLKGSFTYPDLVSLSKKWVTISGTFRVDS